MERKWEREKEKSDAGQAKSTIITSALPRDYSFFVFVFDRSGQLCDFQVRDSIQ